MIQIEDNDLPITAAQKIILGTRPYNPTPLMKELVIALTGCKEQEVTQDMYDLEEIKEIADYLMLYYNSKSAS